ncbi:MAG: hypothetical protein AAF585_26870 [Verrucomicrobiota bacterium]
MTNKTKYMIGQVLALPLVGIPALIVGLVIGGAICDAFGLSKGIWAQLIIGIFVLIPGYILQRVAGRGVQRIGLLPVGAWRFYPMAASWEDYQTRVQAAELRRNSP